MAGRQQREYYLTPMFIVKTNSYYGNWELAGGSPTSLDIGSRQIGNLTLRN